MQDNLGNGDGTGDHSEIGLGYQQHFGGGPVRGNFRGNNNPTRMNPYCGNGNNFNRGYGEFCKNNLIELDKYNPLFFYSFKLGDGDQSGGFGSRGRF